MTSRPSAAAARPYHRRQSHHPRNRLAARRSSTPDRPLAHRRGPGLSPDLPALPAVELLGHGARDWGIVAVFGVVYLGMFLGGLPRLKLDRSGVALLGAIAVIAFTGQSVEDAARAVDLPTIVLLFAFMVVSAQMRLGGFYTAVTRRVAALPLSRSGLLAVLIVVAGGAVGGVLQRRGLPGHDAGGGAAVPAARPEPAALPDRPGLRGQHRLGGHADRQPAEHADRLGDATALCRLPAPGAAAGGLEPAAAVAVAGLGAGLACLARRPDAARAAAPADDEPELRRLADGQGPVRGHAAAADLPVHRLAARRGRAGRRRRAAAQPAAAFGARDGLRRLATAAAVHRPVRRQPGFRKHRPGGRRGGLAGRAGRAPERTRPAAGGRRGCCRTWCPTCRR